MLETLAAASARLCVETLYPIILFLMRYAAASARLCVETWFGWMWSDRNRAAASARLCVETNWVRGKSAVVLRSRLRAAVC